MDICTWYYYQTAISKELLLLMFAIHHMNHQIPQLQTEKKNKFNFIKLYKTYRMKKINNNKIEIVLIDIFNDLQWTRGMHTNTSSLSGKRTHLYKNCLIL